MMLIDQLALGFGIVSVMAINAVSIVVAIREAKAEENEGPP
jgi:hypothetical protein